MAPSEGSQSKVIWTDYLKYRAALRGYELASIEQIIRFAEERYLDTATQRMVAIGRHGSALVLVPYEVVESGRTPITIHATCRQQINF
ncbi:MAG: hypothetical protein WCQ50_19790 [Spirochaetota bacterium]